MGPGGGDTERERRRAWMVLVSVYVFMEQLPWHVLYTDAMLVAVMISNKKYKKSCVASLASSHVTASLIFSKKNPSLPSVPPSFTSCLAVYIVVFLDHSHVWITYSNCFLSN